VEENASPRTVSRSEPSFQAVYRQYFDFVWSCTRRLGVESAAMDDVVQEIFIVIHTKLNTLERPESLRSWIYGIVRRTASTHRRTVRTRIATGITGRANVEITSLAPTPLEQTEKNAELELLAQLLETLDEPKREIFALVELEELTVPEAAEALQIPLNTAYSRLRAARQAFEAALERVEKRNRGT
jgi:RNA polymerase sigma-70 factor (ECF subfamily)